MKKITPEMIKRGERMYLEVQPTDPTPHALVYWILQAALNDVWLLPADTKVSTSDRPAPSGPPEVTNG